MPLALALWSNQWPLEQAGLAEAQPPTPEITIKKETTGGYIGLL